MTEKIRVFLGGTCNEDKWRDELIPMLKSAEIAFFNPVVSHWTPEFIDAENEVKAQPNTIELYVITSRMSGAYSIAEAVQASNKRPAMTAFCVLEQGFDDGQLRSLKAVGNLIKTNGTMTFDNLGDVVTWLRGYVSTDDPVGPWSNWQKEPPQAESLTRRK